MYEYGNARVAAQRGRLLDPGVLRRLEEADTAGAQVAILEREDDWRPILRETESMLADARTILETAIERHRSLRLGSLPRMYEQPAQRLVEALVLPLDAERLTAVLRRRRAGESPDVIVLTIAAGALLSARSLAVIARAPTLGHAIELAARFGLVAMPDARRLAAALERDPAWPPIEAGLVEALDRSREARTVGNDPDALLVRTLLAEERVDREEVLAAQQREGASSAATLERTLTLARLDRLAGRARRDPLGIGVVAGYAAAVEAQAIRLRALLARVAAGWSRELAGAYLNVGRR